MNDLKEKDDSNNWDRFANQSEFFWKFQQTISIVEMAVFAGWYKLLKDSEMILSCGVLLVGIIILIILFLILRRVSQYLNILRGPAFKTLPSELPNPKIKSYQIGLSIPIILILFNIVLFVYTLIRHG